MPTAHAGAGDRRLTATSGKRPAECATEGACATCVGSSGSLRLFIYNITQSQLEPMWACCAFLRRIAAVWERLETGRLRGPSAARAGMPQRGRLRRGPPPEMLGDTLRGVVERLNRIADGGLKLAIPTRREPTSRPASYQSGGSVHSNRSQADAPRDVRVR
jgi:hypothetical protein